MMEQPRAHIKTESLESVREAKKDGYICETCCKVFPKVSILNNHRKSVHSEKGYGCPFCDKVCKSKDGIKRHLTVHTGETPYMCLHCGKSFSDLYTRNEHEKYQHPNLGEEILCKECGKQFRHPRNLKLHMVHHNMDTPYDGKKRQYSNELKLEALKLAKEIGAAEAARKLNVPYSALTNWANACKRKYQCSMCEKNYHQKQKLEEHVRCWHSINSVNKGRGHRFSEEYKKEVADYASKNTIKEACIHFGLGDSTVRGFIKLLTNPLNCTHCSRKCKNQSQLDKHLHDVHKIGIFKPFTYKLEKETLKQFLENEKVDTKELLEVKPPMKFVPNDIEIYDPNQSKQDDSKAKNIKVETKENVEVNLESVDMSDNKLKTEYKERDNIEAKVNDDNDNVSDMGRKSDSKSFDEGTLKLILMEDGDIDDATTISTYDNVGDGHGYKKQNEALDIIVKPERTGLVEIKINNNKRLMEDWEVDDPLPIDKDGNAGDKDLVDEMDATNRQNKENDHEELSAIECKLLEDNSDQISPSDADVDIGIKDSSELDEDDAKQQKKDDNLAAQSEEDQVDLDFDNLEEEDFETFLYILNGSNCVAPPDKNVKVEVKSEKESFDVATLNNNEVKLSNFNSEEGASTKKDSLKVHKDLKKTLKELKVKEDNPKKRKKFRPSAPPDHLINFDIDLTKFGIKAKDEVFCIQSEYMADRNFMNIMMSKRYKDKKKIYKCSHCGKDFKAPSDITRHLASHSSEKSYHCEDCDTSFSLKHNLERHIQKLHIQDCKKEGLKFKCEFCGMDYNEKSSLKTHQLKYHMSEGQESQTTRHQCSTCGVSYAYKQSLNEHVQVEHEGKKLICPICGKHFRKKQSLKSHHREHLYGKELSCDLCGNTFRETYQLTRHKKFKCMKQDNKLILKKFECKECDKKYSDKRALETHIKIIHEGKKDNFVCDICSKVFSRRTSFSAHKLLHTGNFKVYDCNNCTSKFKDKRNLVRHKGKCLK